MFSYKNDTIQQFDEALWQAIKGEMTRQEAHIELIASENYVSPRVLEAQSTVLTNKYAEGYPGKRYYGGCVHVDAVESLAIERAKQLFHCQYANVQPHSGSQANAAALSVLMKPGETLLGMSLSEGGHLTHGAPASFSGKLYHAEHYGLNPETGDIDYDAMAELARTHQPKVIIAGFSAFSGVLDWARFRAVADEVGAFLLADIAHVAGLIATDLYPSPIPHAHVVTTTTHKTLRGPRGGMILSDHDDPKLHKQLNSAIFPGTQGGPLMHVIAAKAVSFLEALAPEFKVYQTQVLANAKTLADTMMTRGFDVVSGGTQNHLFLVDLVNKSLTGKAAESVLGMANITLNKNAVPNDPESPFITSGLRIGSPAVTTRGFRETECHSVANWICDVLEDIENESTVSKIKQQVVDLCLAYPVYVD
jgi:glycine hydroxymethyltransferase